MPRKTLAPLSRPTPEPRRRTRAQRLFLAATPGLTGPQSAASVRAREVTGRRWLTRDRAKGLAGLQAAPRPGRPMEMTAEARAEWLAFVRRRPRRLHWPCALRTLPRLADELADCTGRRAAEAPGRRAAGRRSCAP